MSKVLIIDGNNMAYRTVFAVIYSHPEDNDKFYRWRQAMTTSVLSTIRQFTPDRVIIAFDSGKCWRQDVFPQYKERRDAYKETAKVDFNKFKPIFKEYINTFKIIFSNIINLQIENVEADDIIAVISKKHAIELSDEVIVVSGDKDMRQLLSIKNIKQYDPMQNKFIEIIDPKQELTLKVLTGDRGDDVPPIKRGVGIKTAQKIINEGLDTYLNRPENVLIKSNYERNLKLIDFQYIPLDIQATVINTYNNYSITDINGTDVWGFFSKNKMEYILRDWQQYRPFVEKLK